MKGGPDLACTHGQVDAFHCVLVKFMIGSVRTKEKKGSCFSAIILQEPLRGQPKAMTIGVSPKQTESPESLVHFAAISPFLLRHAAGFGTTATDRLHMWGLGIALRGHFGSCYCCCCCTTLMTLHKWKQYGTGVAIWVRSQDLGIAAGAACTKGADVCITDMVACCVCCCRLQRVTWARTLRPTWRTPVWPCCLLCSSRGRQVQPLQPPVSLFAMIVL